MQSRLVTQRPGRLLVPAGTKRPNGLKTADAEAAQVKTIRTTLGLYKMAEWTGKNESGITPLGDRVLVLTDEASDKLVESGALISTEDHQDKHSLAAETGVLVALGEDAFKWNSDRSRTYSGQRPEPGQRVYFERYAGGQYKGADGKNYRVLDDKAIGALGSA